VNQSYDLNGLLTLDPRLWELWMAREDLVFKTITKTFQIWPSMVLRCAMYIWMLRITVETYWHS